MNELVAVTVKQIHKNGFFVDTRAEIPKNLASMLNGLHKMYDDNIFNFKPHLKKQREIYTICVDTYGVKDNIIEQIKEKAIAKECDVQIDSCYHWLSISNKRENISKYFE